MNFVLRFFIIFVYYSRQQCVQSQFFSERQMNTFNFQNNFRNHMLNNFALHQQLLRRNMAQEQFFQPQQQRQQFFMRPSRPIIFPTDNQRPTTAATPTAATTTATTNSAATPTTATTTGTTQPPTTTSPQYFTCLQNCATTSEYNPVCGSDNQNYHNMARLLCASRCGLGVSAVRMGTCAPLGR